MAGCLFFAKVQSDSCGWHRLVLTALVFRWADLSYTDPYQLFGVNFALAMFGYVYGDPTTGLLSASHETAIKLATSVGAVIGQIVFGVLSDRLGRKKVHQPM